jgi:PKD repeat protein
MRFSSLSLSLLIASTLSLRAATLFVDSNSTNAVAPFTNWDTAASDIQSAVDAASAGDLILVTNGVYQTGGRIIQGGGGFWSLDSQVTMDKPVTVESVNGPAFTSIYGQPYWYGIYYLPAMRCVYLADGATLSGFTLTYATAQLLNGTADGGGAFCATTNSIITNCIVSGVSASGRGGGIYGGTVIDSVVSYNGASGVGGGVFNATLIRCVVGTNSSSTSGGGAAGCVLNQCSLAGNISDSGGAAFQSTLNACVLRQNFAYTAGGAVSQCTLSACAMFNNASADAAGAAAQSVLNHCTLVYNVATNSAGGALDSLLTNCITYYNAALTNANYAGGNLEASCSVPLPAGTNNISAAPVLADNYHLNFTSPCIGAGETDFTFGSDVDGESWANPPAIGCDEYVTPVNGELNLQVQADLTRVFPGTNVNFVSQINGHASSNRWDFGDGTLVANHTVTSHSWAATGDYVVELRAFNDSYTNGVSATVLIHVGGLTNYVSLAGTNPVSPYLSWATAATNIQDAVDVSPRGATVLVDDGVYDTGGRPAYSSLTNRVAVTDQLAVRSLNGPEHTTIVGNQVPGTVNDFGAVRCVYLSAGSILSGFTLTNGATEPDNDGMFESYGGGVCCATADSIVTNCVFRNNSAGGSGGGLSGGTAYNCDFINNNTTLSGYSIGGGACNAVLNNCVLTGNYSDNAGGAGYGTLNNCTVAENGASYFGGVAFSTLNNCALYDNQAAMVGGGASDCTMNNCTITGNSAGSSGGGVNNSILANCVVFYNSAPASPNYAGGSLSFCCAQPLASGAGNFDAEPVLVDALHLGSGSPCIHAGSTNYASGLDIDNEPWANQPAIGCDEFYSGSITGALAVAIASDYTNVTAGFADDFTAQITGHAGTNVWDFGDGTMLTNQIFSTHAWASLGDYLVTLTVFNDSNPGGVSATVTVHVVSQMVHYVSLDSTNPVAPYLSWDTAAMNIQDAIDAASVPGALVLVSNGVYNTGGRVVSGALTNRVVVNKPVTVQSLNGSSVTVIQGYQDTNSIVGDDAVRCVYLAKGATLIGFTLTQGATRADGDNVLEQSGGGAWCESPGVMISNCVLRANSAAGLGGGVYGGMVSASILSSNSAIQNWSSSGGGASSATLNNCLIYGNSANYVGGGAHASTLNNCTVVSNSVSWMLGGGVGQCKCFNSIVYYNSGNNFTAGELDYCNTTPLPDDNVDDGDGGTNGDDWLGPDTGTNDVAGEPLFANIAAGDFHLLSHSPCVNAGKNAFAPAGPDLAGNLRLVGDAVDIGAYELQTVVPFSVALQADATNAVAGYPLYFTTSTIGGPASNSHWDFGDGNSTNDLLLLTHSWSAPGDYPVIYTAFNEANPGGINATVMVHIVTQSIHYVSLDSTNPVTPYLTWNTAATDIQSAADAAFIGGTVLVSNGVYNAGGRIVRGTLTNRLAVTRPMTVISLNGPAATLIQGWQVGATNGNGAIRCVYATNGVVLSGFTLTNGATLAASDDGFQQQGGGLASESTAVTVSNCVITACLAGDTGGGVQSGTLVDCVIAGCSSVNAAGGAASAVLTRCQINGNRSWTGGGVSGCTLSNCVMSANAAGYGGGADSSQLFHCTLTGNLATDGGNGAGGGTLSCNVYNCVLSGNHADNGGGAYEFWWNWWWSPKALYNCALYNNTAAIAGGGAGGCTLINCTVTGNSAGSIGGGTDGCGLLNSIVYYNQAPNGTNFNGSALSGINYSCTLPLADGESNIISAPLLADTLHLAANSPCIGKGSTNYSSGTDIDGQMWQAPPSIGCDEFDSGSATGVLSVTVFVDYPNSITGYPLHFAGVVSGHASSNYWSFGDGTSVTNLPNPVHSFAGEGVYPVVFTAFNADNPGGVSATQIVHVLAHPVSYVSLDSANPVAPYLTWATAATNIQDAVDTAFIGGAVLVSNGVYGVGGRAAYGSLLNRVLVNKQVSINSLSGPTATVIQGNPAMGDAAVRCVYLAGGASLSGFTLSSGATRITGYPSEQYGGGVWCADGSIAVSNCVLSGNSALYGGGAYQGTLSGCSFITNLANFSGGGAYSATLNSCAFADNTATNAGGAVAGCTLNNCTLTYNFSQSSGGGADGSTLKNCILYYNRAPSQPNYSGCDMNYCCTLPAAGGTGNITNAPQMLDYAHLTAGSPCLGAGSTNYSSGSDIDGEAWANPPAIGCDEYFGLTPSSGALTVTAGADFTNVVSGVVVSFSAQILGHAGSSRWDFADGTVTTNALFAAHSWNVLGDYPVTLTAYNGSNPAGVSATVTVHVVALTTNYVSLANVNPVAPYLTWDTAATNIQDAVDAAVAGGYVLVSNGVYQTGGRAVAGSESNRVAVVKPLTLASVNGPLVTTILGAPSQYWANGTRCVYLANRTSLSGFSLRQGTTINGPYFFVSALSVQESFGGGVYCEDNSASISNCIIADNIANEAGGVYQGTLNNCMLTNNTGTYFWDIFSSFPWDYAGGHGGGANGSTLNNCLLSGNLAGSYGGGAFASVLNNCTVVGNYCGRGGGGVSYCDLSGSIVVGNGTIYYNNVWNFANCTMNHCCVSLEPVGSYYLSVPAGPGNFAADPQFIDRVHGNYRLQTNSPCLNVGDNSVVLGDVDLDGRPRIVDGTVDIGAYEFQSPGLGEFLGWLQSYGLPRDGSADHIDSDGDGFDNYVEWKTGTVPTDIASVLKVVAHVQPGIAGVVLTWPSTTGVNYFVQRGSDLSAPAPFVTIQDNVAGQTSTTSFTDTNAIGTGPFFYRVGVQ